MKPLEKIVLINPPSPWLISDRVSNSLGILYVASYLREKLDRKNVEISVVDLAGIPEEHWYFPLGDIYGVTCVSPQFIYAKKIAEKIKARDKDSLLVIGGAHPTSIPERTLTESMFDIAVLSEGEETMLEIVEGKELKNIKGLCLKKNNKIFFTEKRGVIKDLNSLPFPARDMIDTHSYLRTDVMQYLGKPKGSGELTMITSRGCPYNCIYCSQKLMSQGRCRWMSPEKVEEEVKILMKDYDVGRINFVDDMFTTNKKRLKGICNKLSKLGIDWQCLSRADDVNLETYKLMKDSGCVGVTFGIESGSQKILDIVKKRITVERNRQGIIDAKNAGLIVRCQMMVGLPGEDERTIDETKRFIESSPADVWSIHIFVPFPGCDVWNNNNLYGFPINKKTDFSNYQTVGKSGEWKNIVHKDPEKIISFKNQLIETVKDKNVFKYADK